MMVEQEALHDAEHKGAEFAAFPVGQSDVFFFHQAEEKCLRQVLGILGSGTTRSHLGVSGCQKVRQSSSNAFSAS